MIAYDNQTSFPQKIIRMWDITDASKLLGSDAQLESVN